MSAGMVLVRDTVALRRAFRVAAAYMPSAAEGDPYLMGMQWSRRFTGLKVFMSLAAIGAEGYARTLERDCALGARLRRRLAADGWQVVNDTPLPVVCFIDAGSPRADPAKMAALVVDSGTAWISTVQIEGKAALRACITNYETAESDLGALCSALREARAAAAASRHRGAVGNADL
jgi:glutamate/tyrosine decarboxylase-like PLP-dependent enzyme